MAHPVSRPPYDVGYLVATLLCVLIGILGISDGCTGYRGAQREAGFARARGQITHTTLEEVGRHSRRHAWLLYVRYRFVVNGKTYTGQTYSAKSKEWYRGSHSNVIAERQRLERAPFVTVHYDPNEPGRDPVLYRQSRSGERNEIVLGIGFIAAGFGVAGFWWWRRRRFERGQLTNARPA